MTDIRLGRVIPKRTKYYSQYGVCMSVELKMKMLQHKDIKWAEILRGTIERVLKRIAKEERLKQEARSAQLKG